MPNRSNLTDRIWKTCEYFIGELKKALDETLSEKSRPELYFTALIALLILCYLTSNTALAAFVLGLYLIAGLYQALNDKKVTPTPKGFIKICVLYFGLYTGKVWWGMISTPGYKESATAFQLSTLVLLIIALYNAIYVITGIKKKNKTITSIIILFVIVFSIIIAILYAIGRLKAGFNDDVDYGIFLLTILLTFKEIYEM